jgi:heterodisulfide reductase subunit C
MQQVVFLSLVAGVAIISFWKYRQLYHTIRLGKPMAEQGQIAHRWKNVLLVAFGQQKMFQNWLPAVLHLFLYVAFLFTQIELLEILTDGAIGGHRTFLPFLGPVYGVLINSIEILSLLALIGTLVFLSRRNLLKVPRLTMAELRGWPFRDANVILLGEILLVSGIFTMNSADVLLQQMDPEHYGYTGPLALSSWLSPLLWEGVSLEHLILIERTGWWMHLCAVLGFIVYLPYSKHLHIFLAFPNVYYATLSPRGQIENMPVITAEVKSMLGIETAQPGQESAGMDTFGAKDIFDLSWKNLLNAYSCTECGRCTAVCPANITGKKLSPRKIMMSIRDRAEEVQKNMSQPMLTFGLNANTAQAKADNREAYDDGKSLFDYISREEIHACTTCNACVEACPVLIDPVEPILQMRRYEILMESAGPGDWLPMFTAMENGGCVWQIPAEREQWRHQS